MGCQGKSTVNTWEPMAAGGGGGEGIAAATARNRSAGALLEWENRPETPCCVLL